METDNDFGSLPANNYVACKMSESRKEADNYPSSKLCPCYEECDAQINHGDFEQFCRNNYRNCQYFWQTKKKILCVIPSLPEDLNPQCVKSVLAQSYPVDMVVILPRKHQAKLLGAKLSKVLNEGFSHIKLEGFDYVLRVDGDVILPCNFLEENLKDNPDLCGGAGYAMLIKVKPFLEVMNGKFHLLSDDSYTSYKFMKEDCKVVKLRVEPILLKQRGLHYGTSYFSKPSHHDLTRFFNRGKTMYRLGYEPFHVLGMLRFTIWNIFAVFGYFTVLVKREEKLDVADFVWYKQVRRLLSLP